MDLILWRHAEAEDLSRNVRSDAERKLTSKGQKQAINMALWLNRVLPPHCKILVSPAKRTVQTAMALGRPFTLAEEVGTSCTVNQILKACNWPYSIEPVLVVGHQPHLGDVVSTLIPDIQYAPIRKANVWWIQCKAGEEAFLKAVMSPDLVIKLN